MAPRTFTQALIEAERLSPLRGLPHGQARQDASLHASSVSPAALLAETHHSHLNGAILLCDRTLPIRNTSPVPQIWRTLCVTHSPYGH